MARSSADDFAAAARRQLHYDDAAAAMAPLPLDSYARSVVNACGGADDDRCQPSPCRCFRFLIRVSCFTLMFCHFLPIRSFSSFIFICCFCHAACRLFRHFLPLFFFFIYHYCFRWSYFHFPITGFEMRLMLRRFICRRLPCFLFDIFFARFDAFFIRYVYATFIFRCRPRFRDSFLRHASRHVSLRSRLLLRRCLMPFLRHAYDLMPRRSALMPPLLPPPHTPPGDEIRYRHCSRYVFAMPCLRYFTRIFAIRAYAASFLPPFAISNRRAA